MTSAANHGKMIKRLSLELKKIYEVQNWHEKESYLEKFVNIAVELNPLLPKLPDESLFDIDDAICYFAESPSRGIAATAEQFNNASQFPVDLWFNSIDYVYSSPRALKLCLVLETTFLQLLNVLPSDKFNVFLECKMMNLINTPAFTRNIVNICYAIKILRVMLTNKHKDAIAETLKTNLNLASSIGWILNFKSIPQSEHHVCGRITFWLRQQAEILAKTIHSMFSELFNSIDYKKMVVFNLLQKEVDANILCEMLDEIASSEIRHSFHLEIIFKFFMSARDDTEKLERLKTFALKFFKEVDGSMVVQKIFNFDCLYFGKKKPLEDRMKKIERDYGAYNIRPYFSNPEDDINEQQSVKLEDRHEEINVSDYTIEKFTVYDAFMKSLHVLNIIQTSFVKCKEYGWIKIEDRNAIFKNLRLGPYKYLSEGPNCNGVSSWFLVTLAMKCPFIFLPSEYEYLKLAFARILRGEQVDSSTESELFRRLIY